MVSSHHYPSNQTPWFKNGTHGTEQGETLFWGVNPDALVRFSHIKGKGRPILIVVAGARSTPWWRKAGWHGWCCLLSTCVLQTASWEKVPAHRRRKWPKNVFDIRPCAPSAGRRPQLWPTNMLPSGNRNDTLNKQSTWRHRALSLLHPAGRAAQCAPGSGIEHWHWIPCYRPPAAAGFLLSWPTLVCRLRTHSQNAA